MAHNKIREYRQRLGISQTELARRARIGSQNLSAIERDKLEAWPKAKRSLARALGATQAELFPDAGRSAANG